MSEDDPPDSRRGAILALAVLLVLALLGLWVSGALNRAGTAQDCAMQGRTNCASGP